MRDGVLTLLLIPATFPTVFPGVYGWTKGLCGVRLSPLLLAIPRKLLTNGGFTGCFSGMLRRLEWLALWLTGARGERPVVDFKPDVLDLTEASLPQSAGRGQILGSSDISF